MEDLPNAQTITAKTSAEFPEHPTHITMNHNDLDPPPRKRELEGATAGDQELPMLLWMRGDEDWAGDFSIDADSAMKILGIKRSRLTQLTGKELRVARKRVERYIKPFYRKVDLDEYLESARASLTAQKSSETLEKASHLFEEKAESIESLLREQLAHTVTSITDQLSSSQVQFQQSLDLLREDFQKKHQGLQIFFESMSQNTFEEFKSLHSLSHANLIGLRDEQAKFSENLLSAFQNLNSSNHEVQDVVLKELQNNSKLFLQSSAVYENKIQDLAKVLSLLLQYTRDLSQKMQQLAQANEKPLGTVVKKNIRISKYKMYL